MKWQRALQIQSPNETSYKCLQDTKKANATQNQAWYLGCNSGVQEIPSGHRVVDCQSCHFCWQFSTIIKKLERAMHKKACNRSRWCSMRHNIWIQRTVESAAAINLTGEEFRLIPPRIVIRKTTNASSQLSQKMPASRPLSCHPQSIVLFAAGSLHTAHEKQGSVGPDEMPEWIFESQRNSPSTRPLVVGMHKAHKSLLAYQNGQAGPSWLYTSLWKD